MDRDDAGGGEAMKQSVAHIDPPTPSWTWPLATQGYDRSPELHQQEREELVRLFEQSHGQIREPTKRLLSRLMTPLEDVLRFTRASSKSSSATIRIVCIEMYKRQTTFWAWSVDDWFDL